MNAIQRQAREALGQFLGIDAADVALPHLSPLGRVNWIYSRESMTASDFLRVECAFTFVPMVRRDNWPAIAELLLRAAGLPLGTPAVVQRSGRTDAHGRLYVAPTQMPASRRATPGEEVQWRFIRQGPRRQAELIRLDDERRERDRELFLRLFSADSPVQGDQSEPKPLGVDPSEAEASPSSV